ncbi:lysozyme family protein [Enterococcus faecium]|nr:lysozyme family protein [Enterococcus faecium]
MKRKKEVSKSQKKNYQKVLIVTLFIISGIGITVSTIEYIQRSVVVLLGGSESHQQSEISSNLNLSEEVLALKSIVEKYAKMNGIPDEVPFILAIMMVESGGKGLDPMQSSESAGLGPNAFTSPEQSIKQGVAYYNATRFKCACTRSCVRTILH